ncbi:MAG TPA: glycosyltransferase [Firmicutes bacterium]|nr:glycosyltransferase [Bacillota bacterium]
MKKLNILYSTIDRNRHIIRYGEYFKQALLKRPDVNLYLLQEESSIGRILTRFIPDIIIFDDFARNKKLHGLEKTSIPKGVIYWDIQKDQEKFRKFVVTQKIDLIFSFYRDAFRFFFPEFNRKFKWLPNHVNTEVFKDYGLKKEIDFLLAGALSEKVYPLRTKIAREMKGVKGFKHLPHPGYRDFDPEAEKNNKIDAYFAREINKAKIFFTDDSIYKYPVAKYFEVLACNTLLLAPGSRELKDLGFIDGKTFVEINADNYYEKALYYLKKEAERKAIALRGYQMVRERHSTEVRAAQFIYCLKKFLAIKAV